MRMPLSRLPAVAVAMAMAMATLLLCALIAVGSIGTTVVAAQQQSPSSSSPSPSRAQSKIDSLKLAIIDDLPSRSSVYEEESPLAAHAAAFVSLASGAAPCEVCIYFMSQTNHTAGTCSSTTPPLTDADKATCARVAQAASQSALMAVESGGCTQKQEGGNTMLIQPCPAHILCTFIDFCPRDKDFPLPASLVATTSTTPTTTKALVESSSETYSRVLFQVGSHAEPASDSSDTAASIVAAAAASVPASKLDALCDICTQVIATSSALRQSFCSVVTTQTGTSPTMVQPAARGVCQLVLDSLAADPSVAASQARQCLDAKGAQIACPPSAVCSWLVIKGHAKRQPFCHPFDQTVKRPSPLP